LSSGPLWVLQHVENEAGQPSWLASLHPLLQREESLWPMVEEAFTDSYGLRHSHLGEVLQLEHSAGAPSLLYASYDARPLAEAVAGSAVEEEVATRWLLQTVQALQFAHLNGVWHGALGWPALYASPARQIRLMYIGHGKLLGQALQIYPQHLLDYARFASPWQLDHPGEYRIQSELYSLGVLYYELLAGRPCFHSEELELLREEKGQPWEPDEPFDYKSSSILRRLLSQEPEEQYENLSALLDDLRPRTISVPASVAAERDEWSGKRSFVGRWRLKMEHLFPSTWVGRKRRFALGFFVFAMLIFVSLIVTWISETGDEEYQNQALYQAFIAEQHSPAKTTAADEETASPPRPVIQKKSERAPIAATAPAVRSTPADTGAIAFVALAVTACVDSLPVIADVYVQDRLEGRTSAAAPLLIHGLVADRPYDIKIQKQGYSVWQQRTVLGSGAEQSLRVELAPLTDVMRRFTITRVPFADRISIDGRLPSLTLPCEVDLMLGTHELRYLDSQAGFQWTTPITLDIQTPRTISFSSDQVGYGKLSIVLAQAARYGYAFVFMPGQSKTQTTPLRQKLAAGRYNLRIFRDGFKTVPSDTAIFIKPDQDVNILVQMAPL
jgi:hypothetical protein